MCCDTAKSQNVFCESPEFFINNFSLFMNSLHSTGRSWVRLIDWRFDRLGPITVDLLQDGNVCIAEKWHLNWLHVAGARGKAFSTGNVTTASVLYTVNGSTLPSCNLALGIETGC